MTKADEVKKLLTKPKLMKWARSKNPYDCVGVRGRSKECPVAQYLEEQGFNFPSVTEELFGFWSKGNYHCGDVPKTVKRLILMVDEDRRGNRIRAKTLIRLLEKL